MSMIKHIWFDFSGTLVSMNQVKHHKLLYDTYAEAVKKPVDDALVSEYEQALQKHGSNSGVFRSLGLQSDFWG